VTPVVEVAPRAVQWRRSRMQLLVEVEGMKLRCLQPKTVQVLVVLHYYLYYRIVLVPVSVLVL
jgi:hypothetical protein